MDKVKIAVIGIGNIGNLHLANIANQPKVELTAVCDLLPERAQTAGEKFGVRTFTDAQDLLNAHVSQAVIISTPHFSHTTIGIAALQAGYHVLVEKPISVHKNDGQRLVAAHQGKNQVFAIMFNQRTDPHYRKIRQLVQDGELGALVRINWVITDWFRPEAYYRSSDWRATWRGEGGGVLMNQAVHNLDLLQWICGMPSRVRGFCGFGQWHDIEVEDQVFAYYEFDETSVGATGASGKCTGSFITSTGEAPGTNRLEIAGERGKIIYDAGDKNGLKFIRNEVPSGEFSHTTQGLWSKPDVWEITFPLTGSGGQHAEILENFADAILSGAPLIAPAAEGLRSLELSNAILYSSLMEKTIELPLDGDAYETKLEELVANSRGNE